MNLNIKILLKKIKFVWEQSKKKSHILFGIAFVLMLDGAGFFTINPNLYDPNFTFKILSFLFRIIFFMYSMIAFLSPKK